LRDWSSDVCSSDLHTMLNTANWAARLNEPASRTRVPGALRIDPEAGVAACLLTNSRVR
jgi:hypothetical protein